MAASSSRSSSSRAAQQESIMDAFNRSSQNTAPPVSATRSNRFRPGGGRNTSSSFPAPEVKIETLDLDTYDGGRFGNGNTTASSRTNGRSSSSSLRSRNSKKITYIEDSDEESPDF